MGGSTHIADLQPAEAVAEKKEHVAGLESGRSRISVVLGKKIHGESVSGVAQQSPAASKMTTYVYSVNPLLAAAVLPGYVKRFRPPTQKRGHGGGRQP